MNILITGAMGFIGSNFLRLARKEEFFINDRVILLTSRVIDNYECVLHADYSFTKDDFIKQGIDRIDIVFHLGAATPRTRAEYEWKYAGKFISNVYNTIHLLENLPNIPKKIIFVSSVSIYKDMGEIINENSPLPDENAYSLSKFICEKYLESKAKENGFILQILRLGQIYGPGEEVYSKIVSGFMKQMINNQEINIFGDGTDVRSMLFVDDCCRCIYQSMFFEEYIMPVNIASSQMITIKDLINLINSFCSSKLSVSYGIDKHMINNVYDNSKMKKYFEISETMLSDGIEKYYEYYINKKD
jgi:UDP-glucose 4-epimerase